ncbi:MAG TPA: OB-fold domain-containing protein [Microbacteriaceae bacterium]|jgi:uncharacterized OB-fold protein|nr:OB-fold domain-containing protein [Microbacteriaceae bacterium]
MSTPILPQIDEVNRPFWAGCRAGELRLQRCCTCRRVRYPPAPLCPSCLGVEVEWESMSGCGTIVSFVIFRRAYHPAWADRVPYNVALIELDEGPRMISNVVEAAPEALQVGQRVSSVFEAVTDEVTVPRFRLQE